MQCYNSNIFISETTFFPALPQIQSQYNIISLKQYQNRTRLRVTGIRWLNVWVIIGDWRTRYLYKQHTSIFGMHNVHNQDNIYSVGLGMHCYFRNILVFCHWFCLVNRHKNQLKCTTGESNIWLWIILMNKKKKKQIHWKNDSCDNVMNLPLLYV